MSKFKSALLFAVFFLSVLSSEAAPFALGKILTEWPTTESTVKVAFFDADLTLRSTARMSGKSPLNPQDQIIYPDVAERIRSLNEAGYFVAIVSNQGRVRTSDD